MKLKFSMFFVLMLFSKGPKPIQEGLHPRLRRGFALSLQNRWWGILGVALQRAVAHIVLNPEGGDLMPTQWEPDFFLADLAAL